MELNYLKNNNIIFEGLYLLKPKVFNDDRGYFMESWNRKIILNISKKASNGDIFEKDFIYFK